MALGFSDGQNRTGLVEFDAEGYPGIGARLEMKLRKQRARVFLGENQNPAGIRQQALHGDRNNRTILGELGDFKPNAVAGVPRLSPQCM